MSFFAKEKVLIGKCNLEGRGDDFINELFNDGGVTFNPSYDGYISEEQIEIIKAYSRRRTIFNQI